jgi:hypothetical protein
MPAAPRVGLVLVAATLVLYAQSLLSTPLVITRAPSVEDARLYPPPPPLPPSPPPPPPPPVPIEASRSSTAAVTTAAAADKTLTPRVTSASAVAMASVSDSFGGNRATPRQSAEPVYVVVGADREHWPGIVGVVNSVVANTAQPERLRILALSPAGREGALRAYLRCHGLRPTDGSSIDSQLQVRGFRASRVPPLRVQTKLTNLESPLNFARFYIGEMLPRAASKVLYLDADVIVKGDAVALYDASLTANELCAATMRKQTLGDKGVASLRGDKLQARFKARYGAKLPLKARGFNAGVFMFNLAAWAQLNMTAEVEYWVRANNAEQLYALGSQPPLTLAIHGARGGTGRCQPLPAEWHLDCLGCIGKGRIKSAEQLRSAKLFHWNGPRKPFPTTGPSGKAGTRAHTELFKPYQGRGEACDPRRDAA